MREAGQRMLRYRLPVLREVLLGDAGPQLAVGVGDGDALQGRVVRLRLAGSHDRGTGLGGGGVAGGRFRRDGEVGLAAECRADQVWRFLACRRHPRRHRHPRRYRRRRHPRRHRPSGRWPDVGFTGLRSASGLATSRTTSATGLSSRRPEIHRVAHPAGAGPRNDTALRPPALDAPSGSSFPADRPPPAVRAGGQPPARPICLRSAASSSSEKPVPTPPA